MALFFQSATMPGMTFSWQVMQALSAAAAGPAASARKPRATRVMRLHSSSVPSSV